MLRLMQVATSSPDPRRRMEAAGMVSDAFEIWKRHTEIELARLAHAEGMSAEQRDVLMTSARGMMAGMFASMATLLGRPAEVN